VIDEFECTRKQSWPILRDCLKGAEETHEDPQSALPAFWQVYEPGILQTRNRNAKQWTPALATCSSL